MYSELQTALSALVLLITAGINEHKYLNSDTLGAVRAEWNTKDFQKREHSLVKPYQVTRARCVVQNIPCFQVSGHTCAALINPGLWVRSA